MAASAESLRRSSAAGLLQRLWQSSIGKKYVMAITGLGLFLFVIIHMLGNLQIYLGPEHINAYAKTLKATPAILWGARLGLLFITVLHITAAAQLTRANRQARPIAYANKKPVASTFAARTMIVSGLTLFAFILFHLAHFTIGLVDPQYLELHDAAGRHDVYRMMVTGFSNPVVSLFYLLSMGLLLFHLSHGVSSLFQSLGLRSKKIVNVLDKLARGSALILFLGNASIPLSILAGVIK
ncbi:MAG TPA: succinate dehydrogenase cytochrome b subunit [Blastocatellia bacterium]|nr:succinate dehydrogenase cytochrome b subunit [Blastocatellia bacterium]HMV83051.1 succinate dehydrogenase cytochrome b subunit [Blastocatellia bacterium]HMX28504.1 succinate dehydrogenase cytochrome b subunit [Blastocatellia bacterium]HMY75278.1 succinate dehydrogenase cytochrome b subunit [Blastocatellia bacterium]HMZ17760.1 succinate dehydrogenase cytochrome b subunit [Blastocatellia bacterium]